MLRPRYTPRTKLGAIYEARLKRHLLSMFTNKILCGNARKILKMIPNESIDSVVTSPPSWQRRRGKIALQESAIEIYLEGLVDIFKELQRVLKPQGTCFVNFHVHEKNPKWSSPDVPTRLLKRITEDGWIQSRASVRNLEQAAKCGNSGCRVRVLLFAKQKDHFLNQHIRPEDRVRRLNNKSRILSSVYCDKLGRSAPLLRLFECVKGFHKRFAESGRDVNSVWEYLGLQSKSRSYTTAPKDTLVDIQIMAGCPASGIVLDPFIGRGETAIAAKRLGRKFVGIEQHKKHAELAKRRVSGMNDAHVS